MGETIRILHLSDFHFRKDREEDFNDVLFGLGDTIATMVKDDKSPHFVVLTGDLAWSGKKAEYQLAKKWIDEHLLKPIKGFSVENLLIIPGNHDVDRSKVNSAINYLERGFREGNQHDITGVLRDKDTRNLLLRTQKEYLKFFNGYRSASQNLRVPWWSKTHTTNNGVSIGFAGLATSLVAYGEDDEVYGKLVLADYQRSNVFTRLRNVNVRIALIHHPVSYLISEERRSVLQYLLNNCSIILRGHVHEQDSLMYKTQDSHIVELATGSAYHDKRYDNTFQIVEIDTEKRTVRVEYRLWKSGSWIVDKNAYQTTDGHSEFPLRVFNESNLTKKTKDLREPPKAGKAKLAHEFVKIPLSWQAQKKLGELLNIIQKKLYRELRKKRSNLEDRQIRANVFLPDYRGAKCFQDIRLYIPDCFRVNMNYEPEWRIKFPPNQGATGVTFLDGKSRYTKRISAKEGEWESKLKMTQKLRKSVHKDLKWIFSIPLIDPSDSNVILGVMNIDGLDYIIGENTVTKAIVKLSMDILAFRIYLSERPREIITF